MALPYQPWYIQEQTRFQQEEADMIARGFVLNGEALRNRQRVEFTGRSTVDATRPLVIKYPGQFPSMPPQVYSQTPGQLLRRHHHHGTWEICVFGPGQPRWSANLSGATALDEAETVIRLFSLGHEPVPGDQVPEPASTQFLYVDNASILVPPELATPVVPVTVEPVIGTFRLRFRPEQESKTHRFSGGRGVVISTQVDGQTARAGEPYRQWFIGGQETQGTLVVLPERPPFWENFAVFARWLVEIKAKRSDWMVFIFPEQSETADQTRMGWLAVRTYPYGPMHCVRTFPYRVDERLARVPGLQGLAGKKVVHIGCGSVGSKIAAALAATGVNHFGLVDGDFVEPGNAVRHEVGVDSFGHTKVGALAARLVSLNPAVTNNVQPLAGMIGGDAPQDFDRGLFEMISSADLVIDTTGVHGVSRWVNDICHDLSIPSLYASVTNGAWGGEVVRVVPGKTACRRCWLIQYENERPPSAPAPETGVFAPGCDQPTFIGTTYEVGVVANLAAWMAVETILRNEPGRSDFAGDYIRWDARMATGTPDLTSQVLPVTKRVYCPLCNPR